MPSSQPNRPWKRRSRTLTALLGLLLAACTFAPDKLPTDGRVACSSSTECGPGQLCVFDEEAVGRCLDARAPCVGGSAPARFLPDGVPCGGDQRICVVHACVDARCGDGLVTAGLGEECDDGERNSDTAPDACRAATCRRATCGDGVVDHDEECDDGNIDSGDGCRGDCGKVEICGDGIIDDGEQCDDGNANPRDGCGGCRVQSWSHDVVVGGSVNERAATAVPVEVEGIAIDPLDRIYVVGGNVVRRVELDDTLTTIAGNGLFASEATLGQPATATALFAPKRLAVDLLGRVLIGPSSIFGAELPQRIERDGTLTTVGFGVDGLPLGQATAVAAGSGGGFFYGTGGVVYFVDAADSVSLFAGDSTAPSGTGDGGPATLAGLGRVVALAVGLDGRLLIGVDGFVDGRPERSVRCVAVDGTISTVSSPDSLHNDDVVGEFGVAFDLLGRVVATDPSAHRVVCFDEDGTVTVIAGTGGVGFSGDGGPATAASLDTPQDVVVDSLGRVLIADSGNRRVRRIELDGTVVTVVGNGNAVDAGDGSPATTATLNEPYGVATDRDGRVYFSDQYDCRVRCIDPDGTIRTIAGLVDRRGGFGLCGFHGDGGRATSAVLNIPQGIAVDAEGRVFIADSGNARVRRVDVDGTITTIAGDGANAASTDNVPATQTSLSDPRGIAIDGDGRVLIADDGQHRIRRIERDGTIVTIAGTGTQGVDGDGGPATAAPLSGPLGVGVDATGRVLIADGLNGVRRIEFDGTITKLVDGMAVSVAAGAEGSVVVGGGDLVRSVAVDGSVRTIAGNESGLPDAGNGDGGPATSTLLTAYGVATDADGRVLLAGGPDSRIRRIEPDGSVITVAGAVHPQGLTRTRLYPPRAIAALPDGDLVTVGPVGRALRVQVPSGTTDVVVGYNFFAAPAATGLARFAPALDDARGIVFDPETSSLLIDEHGSGGWRRVGVDPDGDGVIDSPEQWTSVVASNQLTSQAGIAYDPDTDTFVVAAVDDHCVQRVARDGSIVVTVAGRCGVPGVFPGFLDFPEDVAISPTSGAVYIADTGNHRVLRVADGVTTLVLGDGSVSSAGEGAPARLFPVQSPRQLALDSFGNLYVASTTTVRFVANVDGDDDADGDDVVRTIFGGGARVNYPESAALCLGALAVDAHDNVFVADACQGFLVQLVP